MPLTIIVSDITKMRVDAIVNATNNQLFTRVGVCGAIFGAAGADKLHDVCNKLAPIQTCEAVMTPGFDLPAKNIIHVAGPVYRNGQYGEEAKLRLCYMNALNLAQEKCFESVAFPLISSGIYGYPKDEALTVATSAISEWLMKNDTNDMDVSLVVFEKSGFALSQKLRDEIEAFIGENYAGVQHAAHQHRQLDEKKEAFAGKPLVVTKMLPSAPRDSLGNLIGHLDESFSETLLRLIDTKEKNKVEVYKRANFDSKLFSKIANNKDYKPKKETVIAFAVALKLTLNETSDLLKRASFTLSRSVKFDVIVEYFITHNEYNIFEINNVLHEYDQPLLGGNVREDKEQSV